LKGETNALRDTLCPSNCKDDLNSEPVSMNPSKPRKAPLLKTARRKIKPKVKDDHPAGTRAQATTGFGKSSPLKPPMALRFSPQENHGF
jgi:hypothetical protein